MYCQAVLPRAGLGNKLFPWARCRVFSREHNIPMIAPTWSQLQVRRLLRRDRDARVYGDLFKSAPPGYVSGLARLWIRLNAVPSVDEPNDPGSPPTRREAERTVVFRGEKDHFQSLTGWDEVLLEDLRMMTRERWVGRADEVGEVTIGIHVRRGDFAEPSSPDDFITRGAIRTPIEWFVRSLQAIREIHGYALPAFVVSDAPDSALDVLLETEAVRRIDTGSAIGDLLVLSKAKLLIASGGSTFSGWAAFLGQMPTIAYPGQSLTWFGIIPRRGQFIGEWSHQQAHPAPLVDHIRRLGDLVISRRTP
jgi:hypothetical protein